MLRDLNIRAVHILLLALVIGVWVLIAMQFFNFGGTASAQNHKNQVFERITVQVVDVVDPDGTVRMTIGNQTYFPPIRYRDKEYERSIDESIGLIFFEADGDEAGGLLQAQLGDKNQSALILDFTHQLTDGIGLIKQESADGEEWRAGLFISDRRAFEPGEITSSQGVERILLSTSNNTAELVISDPDGTPRIKIGVDHDSSPYVQILDPSGAVVSSLPIE